MCRASRYVFLTSLLTVLRTHSMTTVAAEEPSEFQNKGTNGYSRQFIDLQALLELFAMDFSGLRYTKYVIYIILYNSRCMKNCFLI